MDSFFLFNLYLFFLLISEARTGTAGISPARDARRLVDALEEPSRDDASVRPSSLNE